MAGVTKSRPRKAASDVFRLIVIEANQALTFGEIARVTGVHSRTVQNWAAGATRPEGATSERLLELQYVIDQLSDFLDREGIQIWLHRPLRALDHQKPIELLEKGEFRKVIELIDHLAGGPRIL